MSQKKERDNEKKNGAKEEDVAAESLTAETAKSKKADGGTGIPDVLKKAEDDLKDAKNDYMRLAADFDNYKKRNNALTAALRESVTENVVLQFLPLADNYELALKYLDEKTKTGVMLIYRQMQDILSGFNVKEMSVLGQPFDPDLHEAVDTVALEGKEKGIIVEEVKKGYTIGGRVLRYASVKIAK